MRRIIRQSQRSRGVRGFTLVELMIVVAIVGILAVLAVVAYRRIILNAKTSEAKNMISAIRIAQEDYKVERGIYANLGGTFCPATGLTGGKTAWQPTCTGGTNTWQLLPVHVDGPVEFGYATTAGVNGGLPAIAWVDMTAAVATQPWYVIQAQSDLKGDGAPFTEMVGTSFQNTIFARNEGE